MRHLSKYRVTLALGFGRPSVSQLVLAPTPAMAARLAEHRAGGVALIVEEV